MVLALSYEITIDQTAPGRAGRVLRIELVCDGLSVPEIQEPLNAWITTVTGEREALLREERHFADSPEIDDDE